MAVKKQGAEKVVEKETKKVGGKKSLKKSSDVVTLEVVPEVEVKVEKVEKVKKPRVKKERTAEQIEKDKAKMAKLREAKKSKKKD
jgi:hypothetical protein